MAGKSNWPKRVWAWTGLNWVQVKLMVKGALPPTLGLAIYQANSVANVYGTLGYILCLQSLLSMPILPRAKFIQSMCMSVLFTCTAAAYVLLQVQCCVWARQHTTGDQPLTAYNAAASTVAAVFLMIGVFLGTLARAFRPALLMPTIQFSLFIVVTSVSAATFPTMRAGEIYVRRLLITFLTGFAFATGVNLFVFPMTSRMIVKAQMGGLVKVMKAILYTHETYIDAVLKRGEEGFIDSDRCNEDSEKLQKLGNTAAEIFGKIKLEAAFARKEFAYGHLTPADLSQLSNKLRNIILPLANISTFLNIVQAAGEKRDMSHMTDDAQELVNAMKSMKNSEWKDVFELSSEPYAHLQKALIDGLDHIASIFQLVPKQQKKHDVEAEASPIPVPGDENFGAYLRKEIEKYHQHRESVIHRWTEQKGVKLPSTFFEDDEEMYKLRRTATAQIKSRGLQQQLYLQLFAEFTIHSLGKSILDLVDFADAKVQDGTMKKKRFINPGWQKIKSLIMSSFSPKDVEHLASDENNGTQVWVGDALMKRRDPEHSRPETTYEKITDYIRIFPKIMASPQASFAVRAAIAAISLGILAFVRQTQAFFDQQRGIWALIMVSIGMGAHTGLGIFGFIFRISGTVIAMVCSIAIWYIGYKQPGAIITIMFFYLCLCWLFIIRHPHYSMVGLISMITAVLIIGYELQAEKTGLKIATSNGQVYYPIYLFAPIRLLAVMMGLFACFVWTYIPFPVTTHATLRKDLGQALYVLANYYSCVHATIDLRMHHGIPSSAADSRDPVAMLDKARMRVLNKCILMLTRLQEESRFSKYEPSFGGKFPREKYDILINNLQQIFRYLSLIVYAADAFALNPGQEETQWTKDFRKFTADISLTTHALTSTLCLVSASILDAQPLPPYVHVPKPYALADKLAKLDPEILSARHVNEPSYAAFAVLAVTGSLLSEEVNSVIRVVRELVGEVDFSYHIVPTEKMNSSQASIASSGRTICVSSDGKEIPGACDRS